MARLQIFLEKRQGLIAQPICLPQPPGHEVSRSLSVRRYDRCFGNAGKATEKLSHLPGSEPIKRNIGRSLGTCIADLGVNKSCQYRITLGDGLQFLLVVANQPAALSSPQCDLKCSSQGVVYFVTKDVAPPIVLFVAAFANRCREDVKTIRGALFSTVFLHDRQCFVDQEVRADHEITNRALNETGLRRYSALEQILNTVGAVTHRVKKRKRIDCDAGWQP